MVITPIVDQFLDVGIASMVSFDTGDHHRFLERTDAEVGVHGRDERGRQLDPFSLDRRKPGKREGDHIGPGPQVDDLVLPLGVGRHRPHALDQRRAARFHGDARHHGASRVLHHAGDPACLRQRRAGPREAERPHDDHTARYPAHTAS
jgi:hypothetical protein